VHPAARAVPYPRSSDYTEDGERPGARALPRSPRAGDEGMQAPDARCDETDQTAAVLHDDAVGQARDRSEVRDLEREQASVGRAPDQKAFGRPACLSTPFAV
jgi:hypothetical protein